MRSQDGTGFQGTALSAMCRSLSSFVLCAADLSPSMVAFAALRVEAAGLGSSISTQQADAQDLDAWQAR